MAEKDFSNLLMEEEGFSDLSMEEEDLKEEEAEVFQKQEEALEMEQDFGGGLGSRMGYGLLQGSRSCLRRDVDEGLSLIGVDQATEVVVSGLAPASVDFFLDVLYLCRCGSGLSRMMFDFYDPCLFFRMSYTACPANDDFFPFLTSCFVCRMSCSVCQLFDLTSYSVCRKSFSALFQANGDALIPCLFRKNCNIWNFHILKNLFRLSCCTSDHESFLALDLFLGWSASVGPYPTHLEVLGLFLYWLAIPALWEC